MSLPLNSSDAPVAATPGERLPEISGSAVDEGTAEYDRTSYCSDCSADRMRSYRDLTRIPGSTLIVIMYSSVLKNANVTDLNWRERKLPTLVVE